MKLGCYLTNDTFGGESGSNLGQMDILNVHNVFGFFLLDAKLLFLGETSE